MILKALYDYYHRSKELARPGMEYKEIAFLIVIDEQGNFLRLEDCRIDNKRCKSFLVPKSVINRTNCPIANVCWDNCSYVLNYSEANLPLKNPPADIQKLAVKEANIQKEREKNVKNYNTFCKKIEELHVALPENLSLKALHLFYGKGNETILAALQEDSLWEELCKNLTCNVSFRINGEPTIVPEDKELVRFYLNSCEIGDKQHICLVTGEKSSIVKLTTATPVLGSQATAKLVSFQENLGYDSYGKEKTYNAPISHDAEFAYTTALKHLLDKDSKNMFRIAIKNSAGGANDWGSTRTFIFWASATSEVGMEAESCFYSLMNLQDDETDNPDKGIVQVEKVFKSIFSGELKQETNDYFYILGLAPNVGRLAVVYWKEIPIREFAGNILQHFEDMDIVDYRKEKRPYKGVYSMLSAVTIQGKVGDVQPNLPEAVIKSIFQNIPYPYSLYSACLRRTRIDFTRTEKKMRQNFVLNNLRQKSIDEAIRQTRVATIKAYLNRLSNNHHKLTVMLDKSNKNIGYVCGRLFATLEYLQKKSSGIDSIRQRYLNAASTTPAAVFGNLMNLSVHHEEKLSEPSVIFFRKLKNEIIDMLSADGFPTHLDIQNQGRFFVGYHHQMAEFYKSNKEDEDNVE